MASVAVNSGSVHGLALLTSALAFTVLAHPCNYTSFGATSTPRVLLQQQQSLGLVFNLNSIKSQGQRLYVT
jgi:hypothetical protein